MATSLLTHPRRLISARSLFARLPARPLPHNSPLSQVLAEPFPCPLPASNLQIHLFHPYKCPFHLTNKHTHQFRPRPPLQFGVTRWPIRKSTASHSISAGSKSSLTFNTACRYIHSPTALPSGVKHPWLCPQCLQQRFQTESLRVDLPRSPLQELLQVPLPWTVENTFSPQSSQCPTRSSSGEGSFQNFVVDSTL